MYITLTALTPSCMSFFYHNRKPENNLKESIKYTNFNKRASTFCKNLKITPFI